MHGVSMSMDTPESIREAAAEAFEAWRADPVRFVRDNFGIDPDAWQVETLSLLPIAPRIAMSACKGPGKTATLAWCGWWILACHVNAQGYALSITKDNLKDNLWKELSSWYWKAPILRMMFEFSATRISSKESKHADTWFLSARSYSQSADANEQANSLAGLHGEVCFILLDECGDMTPGVVSAAKGVFKVKGQRAWVLAAGNPTTHEGALYWIVNTDNAVARSNGRPYWEVVYISGDPDDPKRSPRIDVEEARIEIETLGRDNAWVMVNILGLFPPVGANQLIDPNDVTLAMGRDVSPQAILDQPILWGLDPAYSDKSGTDEACLMRRQGQVAFKPHTWRGFDGTQLGDAVAFLIEEARAAGRGPDKLFVDKGGVGTSAYDRLRFLGYKDIIIGVDFGGSANDDVKYVDKRTEMWVRMAEWLPIACLPNDGVLRQELPAPRYEFKRRGKSTKFILESKDELKDRGKRSPNRADALATTFAVPVPARSAIEKERDKQGLGRGRAETRYNPLAHQTERPLRADTYYDPLAGR